MPSITNNKYLFLFRWALQKISGWLLPSLILVTTLFVFVPFLPSMPAEGLDYSWQFGMNHATAQGFSIGQKIIFTFGPYASIYTKMYHPATDGLMLWGSTYLGLSFGALVILLFRASKSSLQIGLILVLCSLIYPRDALLLFYPLMAGLYCYKLALCNNESYRANKVQKTILALVLFPIGLLPLIKGSIFILCSAVITLVFALFALKKDWKYASISFLSPAVAVIFFWVISGQSLGELPSFFKTLIPIISGYTEAMMYTGPISEVALYIIASSALLITLFYDDENKFHNKIFLILIFTLSLFVAFKAGFVRHDGHAMIAGSFLTLAAFLLNAISFSKRAIGILFLSLFICIRFDFHYVKIPPSDVIRNFLHTYIDALHGIKLRIANPEKMDSDYKKTVAQINTKIKFPRLQGNSDIYSFGQSYLLASENVWNPRPIFQSYSAYTPLLINKNINHLYGSLAPDNIFFKIEPIDGRLPSLEDGSSWPILLSNYGLASTKDDFLFLKKLEVPRNIYNVSYKSGTFLFGDTVTLPISDSAIFARINISQSLIGKIVSILFKPTQLKITLNLENGELRTYRIVSDMVKTGIMISPLIENTSEFGLMYLGINNLQDKKVKSFVIDSIGGHALWNLNYEIDFVRLDLPKNNEGLN